MRPLRRPLPVLALGFAASLALLAGGGAAANSRSAQPSERTVEVVVTLPQAPLAVAATHDRLLAAAVTRSHALDVRTPAAVSYVRTLAAAQRTFAAHLAVAVPAAGIRWHYTVALDGVAVVLPASQLGRLSSLPGATVWPSVTYHALRVQSPTKIAATANETASLVDAPTLWGPDLSTAGQGLKIAVVDDGLDQAHPFFDPSGFTYPAGFPKGDTAYTTPKVIVARAFPAPGQTWKYAATPFDPVNSDHATHVAGIAAGDYDTTAKIGNGVLISGVAPQAYLGNYKALTVPTKNWGLDGNSPEIAKAIDQAVADGMNVINLSLGEPEIAPERDIVVKALDDAAAAGVVPVVAAGNDFSDAGHGSVGSPGTAPSAITVAASSEGGDGTSADDIAWFSSAAPTPVSLQLKPDVTAPGENVLSSVPPASWQSWDGTSMATPVVAAAAALLMQRHPSWTVAQVKSALESTGDPVYGDNTDAEVSVLRQGGGRIDLARADQPLLFTEPTALDWALVRRGTVATQQLALTDAGGGSDPWTVSIDLESDPAGASLAPGVSTVAAGASLPVTLTVGANAAAGDGTGFVVLTRGSDVRRVPFWFHVEVPRLPLDPHRTLSTPGVYRGDTAGRPARVSSYRYPEDGIAPGVPTSLGGPEQVFRFTLKRSVANFGAVVLDRAAGVTVSPRLVAGDDENRLVGYTGLPVTLNPYQGVSKPYPVVADVLPTAGTYEFVFDTPTGAKPGRFSFRFWVNDTTPPTIRLLDRSVARGQPIRFAVADAGSGVDPKSLHVTRGNVAVPFTYTNGILSVGSYTLPAGTLHLTVTAADYQETKNMEDVGPVLPNTRVLAATVSVR